MRNILLPRNNVSNETAVCLDLTHNTAIEMQFDTTAPSRDSTMVNEMSYLPLDCAPYGNTTSILKLSLYSYNDHILFILNYF